MISLAKIVMKSSLLKTGLALVIFFLFSHCVSKKKYNTLALELEKTQLKLNNDSIEYNNIINQQKNKIIALQQDKAKTINIQPSIKTRKPTTLTDEEMYNLKASYIFNFVKDIEWPERKSHFQISVLNHDLMFEKLKKRLDGKKTGNKNTKVNMISSIEEGMKSEIIFVPSSHNKNLDLYAGKLSKSKTVIVSEREEGTPKKCNCINMMMDGNNVDFEVDETTLKSNGFMISINILNLESK